MFNKSLHAIPKYTNPNTRNGCLIIAWTVNIILYRDRRPPCWLMVIAAVGNCQPPVILTGPWIRRTESGSRRYILNWTQFHDSAVIACCSLLISLADKMLWSDCPFYETDWDSMVAVFKMAVSSANFRKWKLSYLQSTHKYANCVDPTLHMTFHSRNVVLFVQYSAIWA